MQQYRRSIRAFTGIQMTKSTRHSDESWAEEESKRILHDLTLKNVIWDKDSIAFVATALRSARNRGLEEAEKVTDSHVHEKRLCSDGNKGHDDRWCAECNSMRDEADLLGQEIRALRG